MENAFGWLGELLRWAICWVPRLGICRATHGGVKFVRGWKVKLVTPGLYIFWPLTTEVEIRPTARQSINLPPQTLVAKDGKTILCSVVYTIEVTDPLKAIGQAWDIDDLIMDLGTTAAVTVVTSRTFAELKEELADKIGKELRREAQELLRPYGVKVIQGRLSDFAECRVFRLIGDGSASYG
jgi:regulator of protease activity HflC (stomatin/prohibitin superfamily)